ncbi:MAG: 4-(cytidine 5'-diphospho)-2-C-methyl-D-erythritol kinase [Cyclobacteriaceae bacterium]
MVVFPNAKINLGLHIVSKRADGYHNLETCFVPVPLKDILEIIETERSPDDQHVGGSPRFTSSGLDIPGDPKDNLCVKAYQLLQADLDLPPVQMHLHKIIPMGGGLGGGSSNASFALQCLNEIFDLGLNAQTLENYASQLGSDCPFFIRNQPVLATGTGNKFQDITIDLSGNYIALVFPKIAVATAEAYAGVVPRQTADSPSTSLAELLQNYSPTEWKDTVINDFENSVFRKYPELAEIKNQLYQAGAYYASMSGSGSTLYGMFDHNPDLGSLETYYQTWKETL